MIMNMNLGMPQIIILVIYAINLILTAILHGKPREGKNNVLSTIIGIAINMWILSAGGFFG